MHDRQVQWRPWAIGSFLSVGSQSRWGLPDAVVLIAVAANVGLVLVAHHFPYQDVTNHLARYVLIARAITPHAAPYVTFRLIPTPYMGLDLVGAALVTLLGAGATLRIVVVLMTVALPGGMYVLLRRTCPPDRGWAAVGALLTFSSFFFIGFSNYLIGLGLALLWLAAWWPARTHPTAARLTGLAAGAIGLFLVHLSAPLVILIVLAADALIAVRRGERLQPRILILCVVAGAVAIPWLAWKAMLDPSLRVAGEITFASALSKTHRWTAPFDSLTRPLKLLIGGAYVASAAAFVYARRHTLRWDALTAAACICVGLYLAFPIVIGSAGPVDVRWMLPAFVLPFCASCWTPRTRAPAVLLARPRWTLAVPLVGSLLYAAALWPSVRAIDQRLDAYDRVLRQIPAEAAVLPLVADGERYDGMLDHYRHFAFWHTIRGGGRVGGLLAADGQSDGNAPHPFLAQFRETQRLYYPDASWGARVYFPLDWRRIAADYDYIVLAGRDPGAPPLIAPGACQVLRDDGVTLYRVRRSTPAGAMYPSCASP